MSVRTSFCLFLVCIILGIPGTFLPAQPAFRVEPEKLLTEAATTMGAGALEIVIGYQHEEAYRAYNHFREIVHLPGGRVSGFGVEAGYGLTDTWDVFAGAGWVDLMDRRELPHISGSGISDVYIKSKLQLASDEQGEHTLAHVAVLLTPWATSGIVAPSAWNTDQSLAYTGIFGRWALSTDAGISLPMAGAFDPSLVWNLALGFQAVETIQPALEFHFDRHFHTPETHAETLSLSGGVLWQVHDRMRLDAGLTQTLTGRNSNQTTSAFLRCLLQFPAD